ncbi:MAG: GIY-YIG nuclease family protein [Bacteroidetes bacterium]|nr:GIY-YIG nuclease family protein [Bacteroidota bacterium]
MYKGGSVYIMASVSRRTLYVGVTSDLEGRTWEHKNKIYPNSFTSRYNCILLVYYKHFEGIEEAIEEEKRIKSWKRMDKEDLINSMNPDWDDLSDKIVY